MSAESHLARTAVRIDHIAVAVQDLEDGFSQNNIQELFEAMERENAY